MMEGSGGDILPDCKVAWLLVETNLRGTITNKVKLKYGEFITRSDILISKCVSLPLQALQCSGRNPSQSTIDKYWNRFGGKYCKLTNTFIENIARLYHVHVSVPLFTGKCSNSNFKYIV